jgi:TolA-binding protein
MMSSRCRKNKGEIMKRIILAILAVSLLAGCGAAHVIPNSDGKPQSIAESGYTSSGCIENLQGKAAELGVKITNIKVQNSGMDTAATVAFWPMVKGANCTADVE